MTDSSRRTFAAAFTGALPLVGVSAYRTVRSLSATDRNGLVQSLAYRASSAFRHSPSAHLCLGIGQPDGESEDLFLGRLKEAAQMFQMAVAEQLNLEDMSAEEVLGYVVERFHPRLYVACSFQKEASVIMDMMLKVEPEARFFTIDTGLLFPETYATWRALEQRYGVTIDVYQGMSLARQSDLHGDELWSRDPDACCQIRKVSALKHALSEVDGWITGVRREHSPARRDALKLQWDGKHELWKANPLVDWSEKDVWRYIFEHDIPYNNLHDLGFDSIGCTHCTLAGKGREGRWAKTGKVECGLH